MNIFSEKLDEKAIFNVARKIDSPDARAEYLHQVCGADGVLFERVDILLRAYVEQASFLELPPAGSAPPTLDQPLLEHPGAQIGPYKLLQQIGEGGMGVVYMAEQTEPIARRVALKIIKPGMDTRQVIARFEAERQALSLMDHPNIAKVLDAGTTGESSMPTPCADADDGTRSVPTTFGRPYFVMELVKGQPITQYCDDQRLTPRQRLELFVPVCQAIQHAHQKGIIHRDIKPSNVMVTLYDGQPVPKVIDFGVAKATEQKLTERSLFTQYGTLIGTLEYMSPEQAEMSALGVDTRSDIYSLGVLLYELLTGSTPLTYKRVREAAFGEVLRLIREEEPPKPSTRLSESGEHLASISAQRHTEPAKIAKLVRGELDWIVMKTLEKDRNRRYETANDFAADVQRYLNDEPVQACPPSALYHFRKFARRNKVGLVTASLVAASLMAVMAALAISNVRITQEQERTIAAYEAEAEQHQRAEANFRKARQVVDDYFTLVSESTLLDLPGSQPLRKELLEAALRYHQAFLEQRVEDPQLQAELAVSYLRVAQIYHAIGASAEAVRALERGLEVTERLVREHPSTPELHQRLAGVFKGGQPVHLGGSLPSSSPEALRTLQKAASTWERFVRESPEVAGFRSDLAVLYIHIGGWQRALGQPADALVSLQKARALWEDLVREQPTEPGYRAGLASAYAAVGWVLKRTGRLPEAYKVYGQALELTEKLAADFPARPAYQLELGNGYHDLALELSSAGRYQEAEKTYRRALALFTKLVGDFPAVPAYRDRLGVTQFNLGGLLKITDRREAETVFRQALAVFERLSTDYPGTPSYRERLVTYYYRLSLLLRNTDRSREVEEAHRRAVALQEGLLGDFPALPRYQERLARLLVMDPNPQAGEAHRAVELAQQAVAGARENGNYWRTLSGAHYRAGDWNAAVVAVEKSMEFRPSSRSNWLFLAMAHWQQGDKEQARHWYDEAVGWMEKNRPDDDELHCLRAEAAALLGLKEQEKE